MAQLTTREMIDRMKIKFDGKTVRLEITFNTKEPFESVAHETHAYLTAPEYLTLVGGTGEETQVQLMVIVNTDEPAGDLAERLTRHLVQKYGTPVMIEFFQLEPEQAIELWNDTIDTAEASWSVNSQGGVA